MPCNLKPEDRARYENNTASAKGKFFFIQPLSRILTPHGIEVPCAAHFHSAYKSLRDEFIQITPEIAFMAEPETLPEVSLQVYQPNDPADFDNQTDTSIYDRSILAGLHQRQSSSRAATDISYSIGQAAQILDLVLGLGHALARITLSSLTKPNSH